MKQTIAVFGDSITRGEGGNGWVTKLQDDLKANKNIIIYNQGVSGDTTNDLLARFKTQCSKLKPQVIVFAIGINDSKNFKKTSQTDFLKAFENNLVELINQAENFAKQIAFIGLTNVDETQITPVERLANGFYTNENVEKYNSVIKKVCEKYHLPFLALAGLFKNNDLEDGLHPNEAGYQKMFLKIKKFLSINKIIK